MFGRRAQRPKRHALTGNGPIVHRARLALRDVAPLFGEVRETDDTAVVVTTPAGARVTLTYLPGNYVFSRVYNLDVSIELPEESPIPVGVKLVHRGRGGSVFAGGTGDAAAERAAAALTRSTARAIASIDTLTAQVDADGEARRFHLTPLGGSFVWVFIPPIGTWTRFPEGEPARIVALLERIAGFRSMHTHATPTKGTPR